MTPILKHLAGGGELSAEQAEQAMHVLLRGESTPEQTAGLLMGLRARGETLVELTAFTRVMREYAVPVSVDDPNAIDIVGTGGDRSGSFNISTAAMLVAGGAGATVAKHGNRSVSSKCGSADVLEALGVVADLPAPAVEACVRDTGLGFIFAPRFHPALKNVMSVRRALGVRTFFNILGPLCNPAGVRRGLFGAFSTDVAETMAEILVRVGATHIYAVHSVDGLDELSIADETRVFALHGVSVPEVRTVVPEDLGLTRASLSELKGGSAADNAQIIRRVLGGEKGPRRDVVVLNAAFALVAAGIAHDPFDGAQRAAESIDSGAANGRLEALVEASNAHRQQPD